MITGLYFTCLNYIIIWVLLSVHDLHQGDGPYCTEMFSIINSPVCILQFANSGARLAVGFGCGQVTVINLFSVVYILHLLIAFINLAYCLFFPLDNVLVMIPDCFIDFHFS